MVCEHFLNRHRQFSLATDLLASAALTCFQTITPALLKHLGQKSDGIHLFSLVDLLHAWDSLQLLQERLPSYAVAPRRYLISLPHTRGVALAGCPAKKSHFEPSDFSGFLYFSHAECCCADTVGSFFINIFWWSQRHLLNKKWPLKKAVCSVRPSLMRQRLCTKTPSKIGKSSLLKLRLVVNLFFKKFHARTFCITHNAMQ